MIAKDNTLVAEEYFKKAYGLHVCGKIPQAIEKYKLSIKFKPTAKAHNCLGWAYGLQGRFDAAIDQCIIATLIDPDYGNPYNDIGSYLINLGRIEEATKWLFQALNAAIYEFRYYPLYNLGRIFEMQGYWLEAINYYTEALKINPNYSAAQYALTRVQGNLN